MIHLIPFLLAIPLAIASLVAIAINSAKDSTHIIASPTSVVILSPSPQPSPSPDPILTPTPSPTPAPKPIPTPQNESFYPTPSKPQVTSRGNYTVLTYDLGSVTVLTDTANDSDCTGDCPTKPLAQHISDNGGRAGMNGTYFCPPDYSSCGGKVNSFDFPVFNNKQKKWINADKLFWNGRGMFVFRGASATFYANAASGDASVDITGGIVNYPSLLAGGQVVLDEGSLSDSLRVTKGTRSGIGTGGGKLFLVVARSANMSDMVSIFQELGAQDALNLDGGGSVALYDGGYKVGPGRSLPNAVIIK